MHIDCRICVTDAGALGLFGLLGQGVRFADSQHSGRGDWDSELGIVDAWSMIEVGGYGWLKRIIRRIEYVVNSG